jgi:hypothetical protein
MTHTQLRTSAGRRQVPSYIQTTMPTKLRLALAQFSPLSAVPTTSLDDELAANNLFSTLLANLQTVVRYVEQAVEQGADIVVFPEYFLQGILNEQRQVSQLHLNPDGSTSPSPPITWNRSFATSLPSMG